MLDVTKLSELERTILGTINTIIINSNTFKTSNASAGVLASMGTKKLTVWNIITLYKIIKYVVVPNIGHLVKVLKVRVY